jgi:hypothetical protein
MSGLWLEFGIIKVRVRELGLGFEYRGRVRFKVRVKNMAKDTATFRVSGSVRVLTSAVSLEYVNRRGQYPH